MNSRKISLSQIETKICQFKEGVDYRFTGEEYYAPNSVDRGHTRRGYQILSSQLQKVLEEYLKKQTAIFMQFEFEGWGYVSEWNRQKGGKDWEEKYYSSTLNENGNVLSYDNRQDKWDLNITYLDKPSKGRENFNQRYQAAKKAWEVKGSSLQNTPPVGTKCWSCYEPISETDIASGRYRLENTRLWCKDKLTFFKTFEHVRGVCKLLAYDCAQRNSYRYHSELIENWLEYPTKSHEYSCQDCLTRMWYEINTNLIYLETWAKERSEEIGRTKQVLAEIEARLAKLKESGQFHNCGIKKCCAEHDRPDHSQTKNKGLIAAADSSEQTFKPTKTTLNRSELLSWMKEKGIIKISRSSDPKYLLVRYSDSRVEKLSIANDLPSHLGKELKKEVDLAPIYSEEQLVNQKDPNNWPTGIITAGALIIIGLVSVIAVLVYQRRKK